MQTVLLFGVSGKLGQAVKKAKTYSNISLHTPSRLECDITNIDQVNNTLETYNPNVVIHTAALVGVPECEENKKLAWLTNVTGTVNIAKACLKRSTRLIFTSSSTVFDGKKGNYLESDIPSPISFYAITKVAAEQAVQVLENSVIVRLDFYSKYNLKYEQVYTDHYTSKIAVEEAAEKILTLSKSKYNGIINIGRKRESLYNILKPVFPNIKPITIAASKIPDYPHDISLSITKWREIFGDDR